MAQETKPGGVEFKLDTTKIAETESEFVLPEFIITGKETIKIEVGDKLWTEWMSLPEVKQEFYKISKAGKTQTVVDFNADKIVYLKSPEKIPVAKFSAGVGRYVTTYFDGVIQGEILKDLSISSSFYHRASQGFIENADFVKNQFSVGFDFNLPTIKGKIYHWLGRTKISSKLSYFAHSFAFYGSETPALRRNVNNLNLNLTVESPYRKEFDYVFKVGYQDFAVFDTLSYINSKFNGREKKLDLDFKLRHNVDFLKLKFNATYTSLVERYLSLGVSVENLFDFFDVGRRYELDFGFKMFSFENYDSKRLRVYPNFYFKYLAERSTQIYVSFLPEVLNLTISEHFEVNRFLASKLNVIRPENYFNLASGVRYSSSSFGVDAGLSFKAFKNFPIYVDTVGLYSIEFERVQFVELKGSGYLNYGRNEILFDVILRSSYNAKSEKPLPYYPAFSAVVSHRYKFNFGLAINSEIALISNRVFNFNGDELKGFVLVNSEVKYEVSKNFVVFVKLNNVLSRKFYIWNRYPEPDLVFVGGIEYKF